MDRPAEHGWGLLTVIYPRTPTGDHKQPIMIFFCFFWNKYKRLIWHYQNFCFNREWGESVQGGIAFTRFQILKILKVSKMKTYLKPPPPPFPLYTIHPPPFRYTMCINRYTICPLLPVHHSPPPLISLVGLHSDQFTGWNQFTSYTYSPSRSSSIRKKIIS